MYRKQRGITFLGWLILLIPVAIVGYTAIRLVPVYLNYMRVARSVEQAAETARAEQSVSAQSIRSSIRKRFDIESITYPDPSDVSITSDGSTWTIEAKYTDGAPLFANISVEIDFDKIAKFGGGQ
jgi:Domain of unknown function (DUF4845)